MPIPPIESDFAPADRALLTLARAIRDTGYHFTTITPLTQSRVNARPDNARARDLAGVFGWSRPFEAGVVGQPMFDLMRQAGVIEGSEGHWRSTVRLSSLDDLIFLHSSFPTVAADSVFFGPDTCRFATAIRASLATRRGVVGRAVDIGCGAGPGAILIAEAVPNAAVLMVDTNERALRFARINAALNGVVNAEACRSDILKNIDGLFDLIVSNPPYLIDPAARAYRHGGGAWGEGLSLAILDEAIARLSSDGTLVLYTGSAILDGTDTFRAAVESRLAGANQWLWSYVEMDPDVFGEELESEIYGQIDRIAAVVLTVTRKD